MIKKIEETFEQRAAAADAAYTSAHLAVDAAKRKLRDRRAASAAAIMQWTNSYAPKPTLRDLVAAVNRTQPARDKLHAEQAAIKPPSQLDRVMQTSRRGANCNVGYRRPTAGLRA